MTIFIIIHKRRDLVPKTADYQYCGRPSILGNPFIMHGEVERNHVCDRYQDYFDKAIVSDEALRAAVTRLMIVAVKRDLYLGCHCEPLRCHVRTIKAFIESKVKVFGT